MSSRLDRLFVLLSSGSTASTRTLAAKQLGGLVKSHPGELSTILTHLHPLLRSVHWDTRLASAEAIEAILKELPKWSPVAIKKEEVKEAEELGETSKMLTFSSFDVEQLLRETDMLTASQGQEYATPEDLSDLSQQREALNKTMGLDVAARLGVQTDDIFSNDDLTDQTLSHVNGHGSVSARERNRMKRTLSKQRSIQSAVKKQKLAPKLYQGERSDDRWPLEDFCRFLIADLFDKNWEVRHGAATAFREIARLHGDGAGKRVGMTEEEMQQCHDAWLENTSLSLLSVIARDRFGDFVSDQVVAPVRESAAQALGAVLGLMSPENVKNVVIILLRLLKQSNWQCRHGGMLGIKYLLAVRSDLTNVLLHDIYLPILLGLQDDADDVVGVSASSLLTVVPGLVEHSEVDIDALTERLWDALRVLDDLTSSTHSIMQLLSEILKQQSLNSSISLSSSAKTPLAEKVPRLFPFLSHSSSLVRKGALSTLDTLSSNFDLAQLFLPCIVKSLMSHLFQRALLEHQDYSLILIESIWNNVCDFTPLGPLLMSTCPLYGTWVSLITQPPNWPLPPNMLIQEGEEEKHQFLGGPDAQHITDSKEKDRVVTRARYLGAKMLGKLAGFIVQPVPGMDYSKDALSPMEMFATKILLPNLTTQSAYRRAAMGLIISEWSEQHDVTGVSDSLKLTLARFLTEPVNYDETVQAFTALQTDTRDFIATLKHYKLNLPSNLGDSGSSLLSFEQIRNFLTETDFKAVVSTNTKLKQKVVKSVLDRLEENLIPSMNQMIQDQAQLSVMTVACVAGAVIGLEALTEKLNPVIKPLMESIKKEPNKLLQSLSARKLARVLEICVNRKNMAPVEKVIKNLVTFASADPNATPTYTAWPMAKINTTILTLAVREIQSNKKTKRIKQGHPATKKKSIVSEALAINANGDVTASKSTVEGEEKLKIQTRGAKIGLETVIKHFHSNIFEKLPIVHNLTLGGVLSVGCDAEKPAAELIFCLRAFEIIIPVLSSSLHESVSTALPGLVKLLRSDFSCLRHMSARCFAQISQILPAAVMTSVINHVIPLFESQYVNHRQGAIECLASIVEQVETDIVPFIVLLIVPVLGRMSDQDEDVRLLATNTFATLVKLVPLEGSVKDPDNIPEELLRKKAVERKFIDQLMNVKNLEDYQLEVPIEAELRKYQLDGINWLAFLNRYKLHGVLCDDMGLGKTIQSICMIANDHFLKQTKGDTELSSLVICPPTLCGHWSSEIDRFVGTSILKPLVYSGSTSNRAEIRKRFPNSNLIISSYDVIRNDIDFFTETHWNYLLLDEGQVIKNGKTKTTKAIKKLKSNHRLILSGTPIQNSVLELWSLFDFLMPGFLGTEKQFCAKYSRPIVASRDPKCSSKDQEAGALAMEALHRQILPFVLRRMKDDVLSDLPPKITQDFYCDLSPIQVKLYEDFARVQSKKNEIRFASETVATTGAIAEQKNNKPHVFQALQYLRKVCNHPKLVLDDKHQEYENAMQMLQQTSSSLHDISHSGKLPALRDLLLQCGIGNIPINSNASESCPEIVVQHRALIFFQFKSMMDIVENDLLKQRMPSVTYLRLDGSVPVGSRQDIVDKFNQDVSIDVLLLSTSVGGLGLNLTGADTVIFVEHDWNPMKDLQAMDRAHRIGQKKVVNVYRLITRNTIEEKIMGLQKFKIKTANTVISSDNASLQSMATDQLFDLFSLDATSTTSNNSEEDKKSIRALLEEMPELWDVAQYDREYDMSAYVNKSANKPN